MALSKRPARKRLIRKRFEKRTTLLFSAGVFVLAVNNVHQGWKHDSRMPSLQQSPFINFDEDVAGETLNKTRGRREQTKKYEAKSNHQEQFENHEAKSIHGDANNAIDAVFTYVNGSDPELHETLKSFGRFRHERIRDLGQLRWAMRSAYINAPFIRNFIVVVSSKASQIPSWLDTIHPRVRVVENSEIWDDPSDLPSMNSHAIERNTPNILDIAPHYFLFNDDFAIQKPLEIVSVWPGHILHEAWHAPTTTEEVHDAYGKSIVFVSMLHDKKYGRRAGRKVAAHVPIAIDANVMRTIKRDFPIEFKNMYRAEPFRTDRDVQTQFAYQQYVMQHFPYKLAPSENHFYMLGLSNNFRKNEKEFKMVKRRPSIDP